jgi:hypothetical protein
MINPLKMLGDVNAMRKHAAAIKAALEKEEIEGRSGNVVIVMNGNQEVRSVTIDGVENSLVRAAINDAIKRSQQVAAGKLAEISKNL